MYLLPGGNRVQYWHGRPIIFVIAGRMLKEGGKSQQGVVYWLIMDIRLEKLEIIKCIQWHDLHLSKKRNRLYEDVTRYTK